jgi:hypothetical protein
LSSLKEPVVVVPYPAGRLGGKKPNLFKIFQIDSVTHSSSQSINNGESFPGGEVGAT